MHDCPECGIAHEGPAGAAPAPVIVEAYPGPNDNDVKIAEIEAAAGIEREKIWTEQRALDMEGEMERLRGELAGMREILDRIAPPEPDPEPVPVPVPVPGPEPVPEPVPAPPPAAPQAPGKSNGGWRDNYP